MTREAQMNSPSPDPQNSRRYWRSLDRLLDSPAVQEGMQVERERRDTPEFPAGADLPPDDMTRRTMMTIMGASFALAGLEGCRRPVEKIVPYVDAPETLIPGVPRHYASVMPLGASAYGVLVESHDGRPTKIEGNELHPASQGAANTWMQASILDLYDPDRSTHVMRRAEGGEDAAAPVEDDHGGGHGDAGTTAATHTRAAWADFETFWQEHLGELGDGSGLAVLSGEYASPTMARVRAAFEARFPAGRWVVSEPAGDANVFAGAELATGGAFRPLYHVENAKVVVALDSDFLNTESDSVRNARGYADGRRVANANDEMNRLYAVESSFTVTGSSAEHRIRIKSGDVPALAAALASELGVAAPSGSVPHGHEDKFKAMAEDLKSVGANGLVIAGRRQPPEVHALALAMNQALGAVGTTVTLQELQDAGYGGPDALASLVAEIDSGAVSSLVILGNNPAYQASADVDFAGAMGKVAHSVHLSIQFDETSHLAEWHLPGTHFLESWGDARSSDGTLAVVQPLIAPLLEGRSGIEIANLVTTGAHASGYDLVRETWNGVLGADVFENQWSQVLHDGLLAESASTPAAVTVGDVSGLALSSSDGLEVTFHLASDVHDGRFANNGWLQELPDAMTKITWDNAALVGAATAEKIGLDVWDNGEKRLKVQKATLTVDGHSLDVPVFVMPGQAEDSIAVHLGYGRTAAGRVGDGVGFSAYKLRPSSMPWFVGGASATKAEGRHPLAQTQEHWAMPATRPILIEETLEHYHEDPHFMHHKVHMPKDSQLFGSHTYEGDYQWGMTIDLNSCIGCNACVVACQSENNIPIVGKEQIAKGREMHWLRVDRYFAHDYDGGGDVSAADLSADPQVAFQPIPCMHCENAPCEQVCPVAATSHDAEGINGMTYNRCIGTRYCSNNCPYKVRRFNFFNYTKDTPELLKIAQNPDVTVRSRGVMEKCTFCVQRVSEAKIGAKAEGRKVRDGEIQTACQQTCPTQAISFGNIRDSESQVVKEKANDRNYELLGELNNRPRTTFLARLRNPNSHWPGSSASAGHHGEGEPEA